MGLSQGICGPLASGKALRSTGLGRATPHLHRKVAVYAQKEVTQLLNNLEKLDYLLRIYTKDNYIARGAQQKVTLHYHDQVGGFDDMVRDEPEHAIGLYNSCSSGVQGFGVRLDRIASLGNDQLAQAPLSPTLSYLFEAYARHFLYRHTDIRTPAFCIDGFAQYLSSVRFSDNRVVLGRTPTAIARYLDYIAEHRQRDRVSYKDLFEQNGWKPVSDKEAPGLAQRDVPANKAFEDSFGIPVADLDKKLARYRTKEMETVQVELASLPSAQVRFTGLPDSVTDFVLAEAALKSAWHGEPAPGRAAQGRGQGNLSSSGETQPASCAQREPGLGRGGLCVVQGRALGQRTARRAGNRRRDRRLEAGA